ncbi:glutamate receptor 1-like [Tubulanus polymorphus]|uniref:glutamate receptor 1-like n=1 Tax=Tubulanus polymorphus TaxID=672921 RepID=UPI003DA4D9F1
MSRCVPAYRLFVLLADSTVVTETIDQASLSGLLHNRFYWITAGDELLTDPMLPKFSNILQVLPLIECQDYRRATISNETNNLREEMWATCMRQDSSITAKYEIYSSFTDNSGITKFRKTWRWSIKEKQFIANKTENNVFMNKHRAIYNRRLIVTSQLAWPTVIKYYNKTTNETLWDGFCFQILREISKVYNFSFDVIQPPDNQWGAQDENGRWSGMVGMVMRGEADVAVGPFTITDLRERFIDFTYPYAEAGLTLVMKKPQEQNKAFKILKPLNWRVWYLIPSMMIVVGIVIHVATLISPFDRRQIAKRFERKCPKKARKKSSLENTIWLTFGTILEQGADFYPKAQSGRIMVMCWWFFTIIILATYTADLAAYLTVPDIPAPVNSLEELLLQHRVQPITTTGTSTESLFKGATDGTVYSRVGDRMKTMPKVYSMEEATEYVDQGNWVYITDTSTADYVVKHPCGQYVVADEIFYITGYGFVLPENSQLKEAFDERIIRLHQSGLLKKWNDAWAAMDSDCKDDTIHAAVINQGIDLETIIGLLVILGCSIGLALLVLGFEVVVFNMKQRRLKTISESFGRRRQRADNSRGECGVELQHVNRIVWTDHSLY